MVKLSDQFLSVAERSLKRLTPSASLLFDRLIAAPARDSRGRGFENVGSQNVTLLKQANAATKSDERVNLSLALISTLAANAMKRIQDRPVTSEVVARSERWQSNLLAFLEGDDHGDYWYPNDLFLKDYRFVTALTVPCGAQVIDLVDGIGPKTAAKIGLRAPRLFLPAIMKPWFQIHTESRYLDEFNEAGWMSFYHTAVGLLEMNQRIQGIVGTSWFYDPALKVISPRLAYLQDYPLAHGAILVEQGTTEFDIKSATATSSTRRELFERGEYRPRCHTLIWPRAAMISWDAGVKASGS